MALGTVTPYPQDEERPESRGSTASKQNFMDHLEEDAANKTISEQVAENTAQEEEENTEQVPLMGNTERDESDEETESENTEQDEEELAKKPLNEPEIPTLGITPADEEEEEEEDEESVGEEEEEENDINSEIAAGGRLQSEPEVDDEDSQSSTSDKLAEKAIQLHEQQYVPLSFAQKKIKTILADWTKMKLEYVKNLEALETQYKEAEREDQEYMKTFVVEYQKRYNKLKRKMKIKVKEKVIEIKKLNRELAVLKGEDVSHLPDEATLEKEAQQLAKHAARPMSANSSSEAFAVVERRTFSEMAIQTEDVRVTDMTSSAMLLGLTPRSARSQDSGQEENIANVAGVHAELNNANMLLNEEVSRLHQAIEELKDHYDEKLKAKEIETRNLSSQIENLEEFKSEVMRVEENGVEVEGEVDVSEEQLNKMVQDVTKDTREKERKLRHQSTRNLHKLVDLESIQQAQAATKNDESQKEISSLKDTIAELQQQILSMSNAKNEANEEEEEPAEQENDDGDQERIIEALKKRVEVAKAKMKQLLAQKTVLVKTIETFKAESDNEKAKLERTENELKRTLELVEDLKSQSENTQQLLDAKDETIDKLEKAYKKAQRQNLQTPVGAKNAERELKKLKTMQLAKEQEYKTLQKQLELAQTQLSDMSARESRVREKRDEEKKAYEKKLEDMREQQTALSEKLKDDVEQKIEKALGKKNKELEKYQQREETIKKKIVTIVNELNKTRKERDALKEKTDKLEKFTEASQKMLGKLKKKIQDDAHYKDDYVKATKDLKEFKKEYDEMEKTLHTSEEKQRKLYNKIEEMKGKIRVYARCRPFNHKDPTPHEQVTHFIDDVSMKVVPLSGRAEKMYRFNRVFRPDSTQEEVFKDTKDLIRSCLDGYNVCIFAYGQTGTGKTWTITGKEGQEGLVPKAIREVYALAAKRQKMWDTKIEIQMLELYCDKLRDLLRTPHIKQTYTCKVHSKSKNGHHDIKPDSHGNMVVTNSVSVSAPTVEECFAIYEEGQAARKVRKTGMNDESSRSHLMFTMHVTSTNKTSGNISIGKLTMVDLAGSEKSKKTGLVDEQASKEALSINTSLLALGEVINALSESRPFIPYRTNKLTLLLSDSLGGNAKTLMFVCIGPSSYNTDETLNSLNYAERVKKIKNEVSKKQESKKVGQLRQMVTKLKERLHYATTHNGELPPDADDDILI